MVNQGTANKWVGLLIAVFVLFTLAAAFVPQVVTAGDDLANVTASDGSAITGASLFASSGGVVPVLIFIGIFLVVLAGVGLGRGRKGMR